VIKIRLSAHGGLAPVAGPRTEVLGAIGHVLWIINILELDLRSDALPLQNFLLLNNIFV